MKPLEYYKKEIDKADVVSFDIFDTLLIRTVARPSDVFTLAQEYVNQHSDHHITQDFSLVRQEAEQRVFAQWKRFTYTLEDIYNELEQQTALGHDVCEALKSAERHIEQLVLRPREKGRELYDYARRQKKKIVLISDMYLPINDIKKAVAHNGYSRYDKIIVSSHDNMTKASGDAYQYMINHFKNSRLYHLGDTLDSDIQAANAFGITAGYLPKQIDLLSNSAVRNIIQVDMSSSHAAADIQKNIIAALVARQIENNSHYSDASLLGYSLGAALVGFIQWLHASAKRDGVHHLYFLARDGALMKRAYETYYKDSEDALSATYVIASRRIYNFASLNEPLNDSDLHFLTGTTWDNTRVRDVLERFGISQSVALPYAQQIGIALHEKLNSDERRRKLRSLIRIMQPILTSASKKERTVLMKYLDSVGMVQQENAAVIDVGWHGTLQNSLEKLLGKKIQGYYFGRNSDTYLREIPMQAYTDQSTLGRPDLFNIPDYVTVVEEFFTNPDEATMIGIKKTGKKYHALTNAATYRAQERDNETIRRIQSAALEFVAQYKEIVEGLPTNIQQLSLEASTDQLMKLIYNPTSHQARIFGTLRHFDGYGKKGNRLQYVGYPNSGFLVPRTKAGLRSQLAHSYWHHGFLKNVESHRRHV